MITLPGLNPKHADTSGILTPRTLQSICWAAPRLVAGCETLIQLCELEDPTFQRQPPSWDLGFDDSRVQQHERGQTRGRYDFAAYLLSLSSITGTPEDGDSNLVRWVVYGADAEFDAIYDKEFNKHGLFYREVVYAVRHSRYTQESIPLQVIQGLQKRDKRRHVSRAWLLLEEEVRLLQHEGIPNLHEIASLLLVLHDTWPGVPWFLDSLERVVTALLFGGPPPPTERAANYLGHLRHQRLLRGMLR